MKPQEASCRKLHEASRSLRKHQEASGSMKSHEASGSLRKPQEAQEASGSFRKPQEALEMTSKVFPWTLPRSPTFLLLIASQTPPRIALLASKNAIRLQTA